MIPDRSGRSHARAVPGERLERRLLYRPGGESRYRRLPVHSE
ncbi:hypothetical protein PCLA_04r0254 [Pseudomonas citronellolis]|nr:hypothetical protein PCLA_04r0254 [Pseudomonas citronellolis]